MVRAPALAVEVAHLIKLRLERGTVEMVAFRAVAAAAAGQET